MKNAKTKIVILSLLTLLVISTIGILVFEMVYKDSTKEAERQQVQMHSIGVSLMENGNIVSCRDYIADGEWDETTGTLLTGMVGERRKISARENISRRNSSIQFRGRRKPVVQSKYL